jgi:cytochrome P450
VTESDAGDVASVEDLPLPLLDVLGDTYSRDPTGELRRLHSLGHPMARSHRGVELLTYRWVASLFNDSRFHTVDARHFADKGSPPSLLAFVQDGLLLSMESERHDRVRRVLARAFTLRQAAHQRAMMREVAVDLIDGFAPIDRSGGAHSVDLVDQFTDRFPMEVLCRTIGVPSQDIEQFLGAAHELHLLAAVPMAPGFDRIDAALRTLEDYVLDILERRRLQPADDFISGLLEAQQAEGSLTKSELVGNVINLLFAGAGTTRYQLASTVRALVEQGLWETVAARPELIPPAVEEALRYYPVTQFVVRIPDGDVMVEGLRFPARRRVILNLLAASRDPSVFDDPDSFDIARTNTSRSRLPFGWGTHHCLGHALARTAMAEGVAALTDRLTEVTIDAPVPVPPPGAMLGGPEHLYLTFTDRRLAGRP